MFCLKQVLKLLAEGFSRSVKGSLKRMKLLAKRSHSTILPITQQSKTDRSGVQRGRTASQFLLTSILSQSMIVSSLWAMVRTVHSWNLSRIVCWMRLSVLKEQGTQHLNTKAALATHPRAGSLLNPEQKLISSHQVYAVVDTKGKGWQGSLTEQM